MLRSAKAIQAAVLLTWTAGPAFCQPPAAPPAFEVASIKPSDPAATIAIRRSGHRISTTSTSLLFLITWAYDVESDRVYGKPKWLDTVHYDVLASAGQDDRPEPPLVPGQPTELQQMMQTLLAERFKLAVHRETRELSRYALVVAKGGPKVHLTEVPAVMGQNPFRVPALGRLIGTQVSAEMLAKALSGFLGRSVLDETGLKGVFDFKLEWEPDPPSTAPNGVAPVSANLRGGSSLSTAIQEQLGLKLESRKGTVEVLVIDRIEATPTEN